MKKKVLLVLTLVMVMAFSFVVTANAENEATEPVTEAEGYFVYQLNEDGASYKVVEYTGDEKTVVVPETYKGLPVTVIGERAFLDSSLWYIELSENIKEIGYHAFSRSYLEEFTATDGLEIIDKFAFSDCDYLETVYLSKTIKSVGLDAFEGCKRLKNITIENGADGIHYTAFDRTYYSSTHVNGVNEGYNVLYVDEYMLYTENGIYGVFGVKDGTYGIAEGACLMSKKITAVTIPESVKVMGKMSVGYYEDRYDEIVKIENFKIFGVKGTVAEAYALENDFEFIEYKDVELDTPKVTATVWEGGVKIEWNEVENAESYILYKRNYNAKTKKWGSWYRLRDKVNQPTFNDYDVKLGEYYRYTVKARNGGTTSAYESTENIKYNLAPSVALNNGVKGVTVDVGGAANCTGKIIYRSTYNTKTQKWSAWSKIATVKNYVTQWVDTSVENGKTYRYTIKAVNGSFRSLYQKNPNGITYLKMPTPKSANSTNGVKVTWNKISGATNYVIYRSEIKYGSWTYWTVLGKLDKNTTTYFDTTAKSGTVYRYTVRAEKNGCISAYKVTSSLMYLDIPTVTATKSDESIIVSWEKIQGATSYAVYRSEYNAKTKKWSTWTKEKTVSSATLEWVDLSAKDGKTYRYTVRALNGSEKGCYKASESIKK